MIKAIMQEALPVWDVAIEEPMSPVVLAPEYDGSLTYIHKVKDGRNIYFFANSTDKPVDTNVVLRGTMDLSLWNPMNGEIIPVEETSSNAKDGQPLTTVKLKLNPTSALFYVQNP